jgi:RimK family alpha-L-glutamate ligase
MSKAENSVRVGVLSFHNSKETKALCNAVAALGHDPVWLRESNTDFHIANGQTTLSPDVDVVLNRLLLSKTDRPLENLELANALHGIRPMVNTPAAVLTALHKFATATHLAATDVSTPDSFMGLTGSRLETGQGHFENPFLQKAGIGTHGNAVKQLDDDDQIPPDIGNKRTFLQQYLDQGDTQSDIRVYVVGEHVLGAMRRTTPDDDWRANIARGGKASDASETLPDGVEETALNAATALDLDVAGVDLMQRGDEWVVIEVNPTAGFKGFFDATERNPAPYIARHAIERVGGDVDDDRVARRSTQLDDSVPDCKPTGTADAAYQPTVGYTEDIIVNGKRATTTVEAKADTGAARTSIDIDVASEVGAGPIRSSAQVKSGSRKSSKKRPLVDIDVAVCGLWKTVTASVEDRGHMSYPVLMGRDILEEFTIDLSKGESGTSLGEE